MLKCEMLENRSVPSASVNLFNGTLSVTADNNGSNTTVEQVTVAGQDTIQVTGDLEGRDFQIFPANKVNDLIFVGGRGNDKFVNNTNLDSFQTTGFGKSTDYLQGGLGTDVLVGQNNKRGENVLTDPGGPNNVFVGSAAFNNIQGFGGSDTVFAGRNDNLIYVILGSNTIFGTGGDGTIITNATSKVFASATQQVVTFFQTDIKTPFALQNDVNGNGILYLVPPDRNVAFSYDVAEVGRKIVVTYSDVNGVQTQSFDKKDVDFVASFGGAGDDRYTVRAKVNTVIYGAGGNDFILGGRGSINLLKGSAGDDIIIGRAKYNDLTANAGNDTLIDITPGGRAVFRPSNVNTDLIVGFNKNKDDIFEF